MRNMQMDVDRRKKDIISRYLFEIKKGKTFSFCISFFFLHFFVCKSKNIMNFLMEVMELKNLLYYELSLLWEKTWKFFILKKQRIRCRYYKFWLNFEASIRVWVGSTVFLCFGTKSAGSESLEERKTRSSLIGAKNDILPIITNRLKKCDVTEFEFLVPVVPDDLTQKIRILGHILFYFFKRELLILNKYFLLEKLINNCSVLSYKYLPIIYYVCM